MSLTGARSSARGGRPAAEGDKPSETPEEMRLELMRSQGVRALPSFHFWKNSDKVDSISGAKTQALQDAIEMHM